MHVAEARTLFLLAFTLTFFPPGGSAQEPKGGILFTVDDSTRCVGVPRISVSGGASRSLGVKQKVDYFYFTNQPKDKREIYFVRFAYAELEPGSYELTYWMPVNAGAQTMMRFRPIPIARVSVERGYLTYLGELRVRFSGGWTSGPVYNVHSCKLDSLELFPRSFLREIELKLFKEKHHSFYRSYEGRIRPGQGSKDNSQ